MSLCTTKRLLALCLCIKIPDFSFRLHILDRVTRFLFSEVAIETTAADAETEAIATNDIAEILKYQVNKSKELTHRSRKRLTYIHLIGQLNFK